MADNHGNTPAAWTAVAIGLAGFIGAGAGLMAGSMLVFWIGAVLVPVGILVGYVMGRLGYGSAH